MVRRSLVRFKLEKFSLGKILLFAMIIQLNLAVFGVHGANDTQAAKDPQAANDLQAAQAAQDAQAAKDAQDAQAAKDAQDAQAAKDAQDAQAAKDANDADDANKATDAPTAPAPDSSGGSGGAGSIDMDNDMEFMNKYDEMSLSLACKYMSLSNPAELKLNLSRSISLQDVTKLTFLNKGKDLGNNKLEFPEDIKWRRELVDLLFEMFSNACPSRYVKHEYLNILREYVMIYLNSIEPRTTEQGKLWGILLKSLKTCQTAKKKVHYTFTTSGLMIKDLLVDQSVNLEKPEDEKEEAEAQAEEDESETEGEIRPEEAGNYMTVSLSIPHETAGSPLDFEPIIDMLWVVFSHSWASCMRTNESPELWGARYKEAFYKDFLGPLENRWKNPGPLYKYLGFLVGDIDVPRASHNLYYCLQAGYTLNELEMYQFARPVTLFSPKNMLSEQHNIIKS